MNRSRIPIARGRDDAVVQAQRRRARERRRGWLVWYAAWTIAFLVLFVIIG